MPAKTAQKKSGSSPELSVIIPVYNEEDNIQPMIEALEEALDGLDYEVIFVDDGSSDKTVDNITAAGKTHIHTLVFARNFGQTSAMAAGIDAAQGKYIATLDGDLQNDPTDIPVMLKKLEKEGLDMVVGNRKKRKDGMFLRKIPSKIANILIRRLTRVRVQDYGCTLKVFRAELAKNLDLYGELHRFIPVLADIKGAKIAEVDVKHHARRFGQSKYGISRTFRVASDLLLMAFFLRWRQKPMHLFGSLGIISLMIGGLIEFYLLMVKLAGNDIGSRPLFFVGIMLIIAGVQLITTGFIAELLTRTYFQSTHTHPYHITRRYKGKKEIS